MAPRHMRAAAEEEFMRAHHGADSDLDTVFYAFYILMVTAAFKLNPAKLQSPFLAVISMCMAALTLKVASRQAYQRLRPAIVFAAHFVFITLRAFCVWRMQSEQAVHWRTNKERGDPLADTAFPYLVSMCNTAGGLLRVFEVLGLQQPMKLHALLVPWQLLVQTYASMVGFRMAYANGLFYSAHEAHDAVASVANALLEMLVPMPLSPEGTCSSCPGVAVYLTVLSFTAVAVPLHLSHIVEQAARRRYLRRVNARLAAAVVAVEQLGHQQQQQQQLGQSSAAAAAGSRPVLPQQQQQALDGWGADAAADTSLRQQQQQQQQHGGIAAGGASEQQWKAALQATESNALLGSYLDAWAVHIVVVVGALLLCWLVSEVVALLLLPRLLPGEQLGQWCPNRPRVPFKIAGEVYEYVG